MGCTNVPNEKDAELLERAARGEFSQPDPEIIKEYGRLDLTPQEESQRIEKLDQKIEESIKEGKFLAYSEIEKEISRMVADPAEIFAEEIRYDQPIKMIFDPSEFRSQELLEQFKRDLAQNPDAVLLVDHTTIYDQRVRSGADSKDPVWIQYHTPMPTVKSLKMALEKGNSPVDKDKDPFHGHHWRREKAGPIWEMKKETHKEHSIQLHDFEPKESVDRNQWNQQRENYRKTWVKEYLGPYWTETIKNINLEER